MADFPVSRSLDCSVHDRLAESPSATVGIAVRDPATGIRYDWNAHRSFHAASTMKVAVLVEVFRRVEAGTMSLDETLVVKNAFRSIVDGSQYSIEGDSDEGIYNRLGESMTLHELARRMIVHSSNLSTNLLIEHLSPEAVQRTVQQLGADRMRVRRGVEDLKAHRQGLNNTVTPAALATVFERLGGGTAVSVEADRTMIELLSLDQPRAAIPIGLSDAVQVAHKTGWTSTVHHDAALIRPAGQPSYVLVVLAEGLSDRDQSTALIADIARLVHRHLRSRE